MPICRISCARQSRGNSSSGIYFGRLSSFILAYGEVPRAAQVRHSPVSGPKEAGNLFRGITANFMPKRGVPLC